MDYTLQTWVDDDGSGATGTVFTAARMNHMEAGIADAAGGHLTGVDSAKPVAAAANKNWRYYATDTGIEYQSDGTAWVPLYPLNTTSLKASGTLSAGTISSSAAGGGGGSGVILDPAGLVNVDRVALSGNVFSGGVTNDTQRRIAIDYTGKITWGSGAATGDVNLYRIGVGLVGTDGTFVIRAGGGIQVYGASGDANPTVQIEGSGLIHWGPGGAVAVDLSLYRDSAGRAKTEGTVAGDTAHVVRNKSSTGFSGWQYNDSSDTGQAFIGWANPGVTGPPAGPYLRINPGANPIKLMYNAVTRYENNGTGMAWWGNTPIARPARPTTLTEVINLIANYGLSL